MKRTLMPAIIAALSLTVLAQQEDQSKSRRDPAVLFNRIDGNQDGKVSLEEFIGTRTKNQEQRTERFKKIDQNADGALTLEEFKAAAGKYGQRRGKNGG
jgi:Ca2+-binding EF-hand superfamily protein